jgi:hypothetical protein
MNTIEWQDSPPDYKQWMSVKNEGIWWLKITIPSTSEEGLVFSEFCIYEVVRLYFQPDPDSGFLSRKGKLVFDYSGKSLSCDDLPEYFSHYKWQPVVVHSDRQ